MDKTATMLTPEQHAQVQQGLYQAAAERYVARALDSMDPTDSQERAAASGDEEAKGREGAGTPPVRRVGIRCRVDECVRSTLLLVQVASVGVDVLPEPSAAHARRVLCAVDDVSRKCHDAQAHPFLDVTAAVSVGVGVRDVAVHLRNFAAPLAVVREVTAAGSIVLAQHGGRQCPCGRVQAAGRVATVKYWGCQDVEVWQPFSPAKAREMRSSVSTYPCLTRM